MSSLKSLKIGFYLKSIYLRIDIITMYFERELKENTEII